MFKKIYMKCCEILSMKNIFWLVLALAIVLVLPVLGCSFVNRASGDDFTYAVYTREAWVNTHSLIEVLKAACRRVQVSYEKWQGTWFTLFLFTLQPEIFSTKAYVGVTFFMLFIWYGSTFLLYREIFKEKIQLDKYSTWLIILLFMILNISFIPGTKSSLYWYNGCAHYMIPFTMCQVVAYWFLKWGKDYRIGYLLAITVLMTLLGGANYQAALLGLIIACYYGIANWAMKKDGRVLGILLPIFSEVAGLLISVMAPGNKNRGGEEFGFSIAKIVEVIGMCFIKSAKECVMYMQMQPLIFVGLVVIFIVLVEAFSKRKKGEKIKYPIFGVVAMYCMYSAMQAPELYANVEVSQGVRNTNFQVFMIFALYVVIVLAERVESGLRKHRINIWNNLHNIVIIPALCLCMILIIFCRSNIKLSTSWICFEYISSGQAADYKWQMEQFTELMTQEGVDDVVIPFINGTQGPLMHMPATEDPSKWTNTVIKNYYGKNSVVAMPRSEWEEKYDK